MFWRTRKLLRSIDVGRIEEAIHAAEHRTSGEIRVSVAPLFWGSLRRMAEKAFQRLGMTHTRHRNGVLFFIVPSRRRFVVLGDRGIHEKVGQDFWEKIAAAMSAQFKGEAFTEGIVRGIHEVGEQLATHFPVQPGADLNELPDDVDFGGKPLKPRP